MESRLEPVKQQHRTAGSDGDRSSLTTSTDYVTNLSTQMHKSMIEELDRRRLDWEKQVERVQQDFFHVKFDKFSTQQQQQQQQQQLCLPLSDTTTDDVTSERQCESGCDVGYVVDNSNEMICRWHFDVRLYKPEQLNVRVENNRLIVTGRQYTDVTSHHSNSVTRQFTKEIDIPCDVRQDQMTSYLTREGVLTVQAPVDVIRTSVTRPLLHDVTSYVTTTSLPRPLQCDVSDLMTSHDAKISGLTSRSRSESAGEPREMNRYFQPIEPAVDCDVRSIPAGTISSCPQLIQTDDGQLMLQMVVDLGRTDYRPDDVTVHVTASRLTVSARHDERRDVLGKVQTVSQQLDRHVDLRNEAPLEGSTVRAMLDSDGRLWIGASLVTNSNHRTVNSSILHFMPRYAQQCLVTFT
jgi:HSP20 family molecular chaperone IbpA